MRSLGAFTVLSLAAATAIFALPTTTTHDEPSTTVAFTGVTHSIVAGLGGLHFDPNNVVAEPGDVVEWHFLPKNHTIAQSSFANPCEPLADGSSVYAGFHFVTAQDQASDVFQLVVKDKKPFWYYCAQLAGSHCQKGMSGVINQNFDSLDFTLAKYKEHAALTNVSIVPDVEQGGAIFLNPHPLEGF